MDYVFLWASLGITRCFKASTRLELDLIFEHVVDSVTDWSTKLGVIEIRKEFEQYYAEINISGLKTSIYKLIDLGQQNDFEFGEGKFYVLEYADK